MTRSRRAVGESALHKASPAMLIAFLLPSILLTGFFSYFPAVDGIVMSFQKCSMLDMFTRPFVGFKNYENVLGMHKFWSYWSNTAQWTVGCVAFELLVGFLLALLLQKAFKGKGLYEAIVFVPWALSGFVVGVIFRWIFNGSSGVLNDLLLRLGIISSNVSWLSNANLAMGSCMIAKVWTGFSFFAIVLMSAMKTIPREVHESAEIDGANGAKRFWYITLPYLKTVLVFGVLLRMIANFGNIDIILGMTGGGPAGATLTVMAYVMMSFRGGENLGTNYGNLAAFSVIIWLFMLAVTLFYMAVTRVARKDG